MICLPIRRTLAGDRPGLSLQTEAAQCIYTSLQMFANRKKTFRQYLAMHQRSRSDLLPDSHYSSLDVQPGLRACILRALSP